MGKIVRGKKTGATLVAGGFVVWLGLSALFPRDQENQLLTDALFPATGAACFFLVACFLPEYRERRNARLFLSRRSALEAMAFLVWLALFPLSRMPEVAAALQSLGWFHRPEPVLVFGAIAAAIASYFIAKYLIRGFHAVPEYDIPVDENEPPLPAVAPNTHQSMEGRLGEPAK